MPRILFSPAPNLTLTTAGASTTVRVQYSVTFTALEVFLAEHGLTFREAIYAMGIDPPEIGTSRLLYLFPPENIPVPPGTTPLTIARDRSFTVPRRLLQEDPAPGDADEIQCGILIEPLGLPAEVSAFTDQEILPG
jgi:hypothetical protein